jgi:hypothetical protein
MFLGLLGYGSLLAQTQLPAPFHPCLSAGIKKSVVFLGTFEAPSTSEPKERPQHVYVGTGFLITIDDIFYLVTAKHVVEGFRQAIDGDKRMFVFLNGRDGKVREQSIAEVKTILSLEWILGKDSDLALIPFGIRPDFDVKAVPEKMFLESTQLLDLQDLFFVSFQPGIDAPDSITPVTRRGMVSVLNSDGTFYMDAFAFPGNSGSPVFIKPSPATFVEGGTAIGDPRACQFVGVIGEYLPYQEVAISTQTKRPRVIFEENTGLARVWPVQALRAITASPAFKVQHEQVKAKAARKSGQ